MTNEKLCAKEVLLAVAGITEALATSSDVISPEEVRKWLGERPLLRKRTVDGQTNQGDKSTSFVTVVAKNVCVWPDPEVRHLLNTVKAIKIDLDCGWGGNFYETRSKDLPWYDAFGYSFPNNVSNETKWGGCFRKIFGDENIEMTQILEMIRDKGCYFHLYEICSFLKNQEEKESQHRSIDLDLNITNKGNTFVVMSEGELGICTVRYNVESDQPYWIISEFCPLDKCRYYGSGPRNSHVYLRHKTPA